MLLSFTKRCCLVHIFIVAILAWHPFAANAQPGRIPTSKLPGAAGGPELMFDRSLIDFQSQGILQENCINIPLSNRGDGPKMLTILQSEDPKHFRINSPVQEMMPMQIEPHGSVYLNICFKADKEKEYHSKVIAVFGEDTVTLNLVGKGVKQKVVGPIPTVLALTAKKAKNHIDRILSIELPTRSTITLEVDDVLGKSLRKLIANELKSPGEYEVDFNWTDDNQKPLPAGTYFIRLEATSLESHEVSRASVQLKLKP